MQNRIEHRKTVEEWVRRYQARLRAYIFTRTGEEEATDDLAQDVFVVVVERIDRFDFSKDPWPWLVGIAHNKLRQYWHTRKTAGRTDQLEVLVADNLLRIVEQEEKDETEGRLAALKACTARLGKGVRRLVEMVYFEGLNCVQTAERLGRQVNAVRTALHRARQALRKCVDTELQGERR
jgi:RNA polymerase sigma-70 factor